MFRNDNKKNKDKNYGQRVRRPEKADWREMDLNGEKMKQ